MGAALPTPCAPAGKRAPFEFPCACTRCLLEDAAQTARMGTSAPVMQLQTLRDENEDEARSG